MFPYREVFHRGHMFMKKIYHKKRTSVISTLQMTIKKIIVCEHNNNYLFDITSTTSKIYGTNYVLVLMIGYPILNGSFLFIFLGNKNRIVLYAYS